MAVGNPFNLPVYYDDGLRFGTGPEMIAEIKRLREALKPFASVPPVQVDTAKHYWMVIGTPDRSHFTREDLARACEALGWHMEKTSDA